MPILRTIGRLAFEAFYRRRHLGDEIPGSGPAILVANHPNGLVDPLAMMISTAGSVRFLAKAPLFQMPVIGSIMRGMGALPVYRSIDGADTSDNKDTFSAVFDALDEGELVALFPEGISHSLPNLQTLKTGAARMALGAEARAQNRSDRELGVRIVPVGLNYGRKGRFRSRMTIRAGEPIEVRDWIELHERDERAAVRALTDRIAEGLREVTLQLDDWEDLPLIELAVRLSPRDGTRPEEREQRYVNGIRRLRVENPVAADELQSRVSDFRDRLEFLRLAPEDLDLSYTRGGVFRFVSVTILQLCVTLPLAAIGAALWWLPYQLTGWISRLRRVDSDIVATQKLLLGIALFLIWWVSISCISWKQGSAEVGIAAALLTPLFGYLTLRWGDRFRAARRDVSSFFRFNAAESLKLKLRARREELLEVIQSRKAELDESAP